MMCNACGKCDECRALKDAIDAYDRKIFFWLIAIFVALLCLFLTWMYRFERDQWNHTNPNLKWERRNH